MSAKDPLLVEARALEALPIAEVRKRWRERFGINPPAHRSKDLMIRAYAFHLQSLTHGGLKRETKRRLSDLGARFLADRRYSPAAASTAKEGCVYVRDWNGRRYAVTKTGDGFLLDGQTFASLSAVAFAITGVKWSGPRFFRETKSGEARRS